MGGTCVGAYKQVHLIDCFNDTFHLIKQRTSPMFGQASPMLEQAYKVIRPACGKLNDTFHLIKQKASPMLEQASPMLERASPMLEHSLNKAIRPAYGKFKDTFHFIKQKVQEKVVE